MKANQRTTSLGFTLIELLVSLVITTIIVTILVTVTVTSLDIWNRSRSEVRASLQGKAMIDSMAADFESMAVRSGNNFQWLYAKYATPASGPNNNLSPNALDLIFFSAATDRYEGQVGVTGKDLGGDISTIAYQLNYKDPIGDANIEKFKTFVLYRKIVDPKPTFDNLLGKTTLKSSFDTYAASGANAINAKQNFICENIYQFSLKFHIDVIDKNNLIKKTSIIISSANPDFIVTGNGLVGPTLANTGLNSNDFNDPAAAAAALAAGKINSVEVSLTVLTDFAIKQLHGRNFNDEQLSDFIAQNSYQYSKLISVPSY